MANDSIEIPMYLLIYLDIEIADILYVEKEEWEKEKDEGHIRTACIKLKSERKVKEFALDLLYKLGYAVKLVR